MTQIEQAKIGKISPEVEKISQIEGIPTSVIAEKIATGRIVILKNKNRKNVLATGVGAGLKIKVNANIGTSLESSSIDEELEKVRIIEATGADTLMDLSTGENIDKTREQIISATNLPIGTVPMYQAGKEALDGTGDISSLSVDKLFNDIEKHCKSGVDFITVHCGVTKYVVDQAIKHQRITGIVSRGGSMLASWIKVTGQENPLYEYYDRLIEIAHTYDVTLSLGDGIRPGCGNDAGDASQVAETIVLGELVKRARKAGVQTMVEGPGHVPINKIESIIRSIKMLTYDAPLYVLGPIVTDIAPGYDHITSAIGGAIAASCGADFLCYVTPSEHISLPDVKSVREGIIAAKIAAHTADIANEHKDSIERDKQMSIARHNLDWEKQQQLSIDKCVFNDIKTGNPCTMCGQYCSMKIYKQYF